MCHLIISASSGNIPAFSTLVLDGSSAEFPFANSLTLTNNDFANFQHCDKDFIPIAYGLWWTSRKDISGPKNVPSYSFDSNIDHGNVKGGAFLWGEYGIAIDFERYESVVLFLIFADGWLQCTWACGNILEREIRFPLYHAQ
jgi:hypothetical protein